VKRFRDPRFAVLLVVLAALLVAAIVLPLPDAQQIRDWARSVGPAFPLLFFVAHTVVCVLPFPRTAFTLASGLLFGSVTGILVAVSATTLSAALAFLLVRALGRDVFARHLTHPAVQAVDTRLAKRGWLAVGSLRLIAPVPFSVVNYCAGVSSIRLAPYMFATLVGVIPGTVGVVVLGDALTGRTNPALLVLSGICIAIGIAGLVVDARLTTGSEPAQA